MKASKGKRIASSVPYGYVKDPDDYEKWHIDEPAAQVVRKIYALCVAGRGPSQIARQLENECVMCPAATGRKSLFSGLADFMRCYESDFLIVQEQTEWEKSIADCEERLREADKAAIDLRMLLSGLREFSMVRELTPTIVNTLIQRIEIHNNDKSSGHCYVILISN